MIFNTFCIFDLFLYICIVNHVLIKNICTMSEDSYIYWRSMSDKALMQQIGSFVQHQRVQQNKTQADVSHSAGISRSTLSLLERGETVTLSTFIQVLRVLDLLYLLDAFKVQVSISPLLLAKEAKAKRYRAPSKKQNNNYTSDW